MRYVIALQTGSDDLSLVGGKARSLSRLIREGMPVPGGYVVTTAGYREFVATHGLQAKILELAVPEVIDGALSFEAAARGIHALFEALAMPDEITNEVVESYRQLGDSMPVAVRSSANAEDLPELSFAGQQETYLNVRGTDALLPAVRDCWASLWTAQAISYRHQMLVPQDAVAMAVVVQNMIPADIAGVLFTANPVTGDRSEVIVNASFGLGELVVSGRVTPDTFVIDRQTGTTRETVVGDKAEQIVSDPEQGTRQVPVPEAARRAMSLDTAVLERLLQLSIEVERLFDGVPQDVEWAVADGQVALLQARPITNLPPQPLTEVSWEPPPPTKALLRRQVVEMMPEPLSPLFDDLYLGEGQEIGNRQYQEDQDFPFRIDGPWYVTVNGYGYNRADLAFRQKRSDEGAQTKWGQYRKRFDWWLASTLGRSSVGSFLNELSTVRDWRRRILPGYLAVIEEWQSVDPGAVSNKRLMEGIRTLTITDAVYWAAGASKVFGAAKMADQALQDFLAGHAPDTRLTSGQFLTGFDSKTMQSNRALWTLAQQVRRNHPLYQRVVETPEPLLLRVFAGDAAGQAVASGFEDYLRLYGHQIHNLDYVQPTQREDPTALLTNLKSMVLDHDYDPAARQAQISQRRASAMKSARSTLKAAAYLRFRWLLFVARHFYPVREETAFYMGMAWPTLRPLALELGCRLAEGGSIRQADDVFYLRADELEAEIVTFESGAHTDLRRAIHDRRQLREARKRLHPPGTVPPEVQEEFGARAVAKVNDDGSSTLAGFAVSPGIVTGEASLIRSPADFGNMKRNSILVCPMTTPAWTQLFSRATGLVTDIGGITAHGSIVAREYGIPAVLGTGNITERVRSGDSITVDGNAGTVVIHDGE